MKVLFDAFWWVSGPPSGRNVLRSFVKLWCDAHPSDEVTLCARRGEAALVREEVATWANKPLIVESRSRIAPHGLWVGTGMGIDRRQYDATITQNFTPIRAGRLGARVAFVHDAIFVDHPEWFTRPERVYLSTIRPLLRRASLVLTSSRAELSRITRVWPESAEKVVAVSLPVPLGVSESVAEPVEDLLPGFLLAVGRLNARKNLARLIEAYTSVEPSLDASANLVIVGAANGLAANFPLGPTSRIVLLGHVSDGQLRWLYQNAALLAFPSLDEGYGLPLVEAARFGTPSIASDIPAFREIGLAVDYFSPTDSQDIARSILVSLAHIGSKSYRADAVPNDLESFDISVMRSAISRASSERSALS